MEREKKERMEGCGSGGDVKQVCQI